MLLTSAPVAGKGVATLPLPLDLHVLSLSLAFILSQDQTLRCCLSLVLLLFRKKLETSRLQVSAWAAAAEALSPALRYRIAGLHLSFNLSSES